MGEPIRTPIELTVEEKRQEARKKLVKNYAMFSGFVVGAGMFVILNLSISFKVFTWLLTVSFTRTAESCEIVMVLSFFLSAFWTVFLVVQAYMFLEDYSKINEDIQ